MRGLTWTAAIWAIALVVAAPRGWRSVVSKGRVGLSRSQWAIVFVLLGAHSFAASTSAEEVVTDPVVIERVLRGGLDALALLITVPALVSKLRSGATMRSQGLTSLVMYGGVAAISTLYSIAAIVTFGKAFELAAALAAVVLIAVDSDPGAEFRSTVRLVVVLEAALVLVAIVGFFLLPGTFHSSDMRPGFITARTMGSPYAHFDGLSATSALIFAYALAFAFRSSKRTSKIGWSALALLGTLGILLTSGRQGLVIWLVSAAVLLWFYRRSLLLIFVAPATALVAWANWDTIWGILTRNQAAINVSTWSGRLIWWSVGLQIAASHPLTGFGFGAGGRWAALQQIGQDSASSIHNGYLEALLGVGIIGLALLLIPVVRVLIWSARNLVARVDTPYAILIVPLLLHTFVSLGFGGWVNADLVLLACLAGIADTDHLRARRPSERDLLPLQQLD